MTQGGHFDVHQSWGEAAECRSAVQGTCSGLSSISFNASNAPSISTLISCSPGLITVDKETSTAPLINSTVRDYHSTRTDVFGKPHAPMSELCLTYRNSREDKASSADPSTLSMTTPFWNPVPYTGESI